MVLERVEFVASGGQRHLIDLFEVFILIELEFS